jgi:hypothetical protein
MLRWSWLSIYPHVQLENHWTDFHETYTRYAIGGHQEFVLFNSVQSAMAV